MPQQFLSIKVPLQGVRHEYAVTLEDKAKGSADYLAILDRLKREAAESLLEHIKDHVRFDTAPAPGGFTAITAYLVLAPEHTDMDGLQVQVTSH